MKYLIICVTAILLLVNASFAQNTTAAGSQHNTGIYLTPQDFQARKLSYSKETAKGQSKIRLNEFFGSSAITIIQDGKTIKINKNDIYGYHDQKSGDFRFHDNKRYQIIGTTGFYLYKKLKSVPNGKGRIDVPVYYFSVTSSAPIQPLTLSNIKLSFAQNQAFLDKVDDRFNSDSELAAFDNVYQSYKISHVYERALAETR